MKYGHFDDQNREYVITQPDTPLPWINYLGCQAYFGIISNTAGGYSFYRDARLRRLTRYRYNNVPLDFGGRYIYLRDDESKRVLVAIAGSPRATSSRTTPAATAWATPSSARRYSGIEAHTRYFVPLDENLEIWQFTVTNQRDRRRRSISGFRQHRVLPVGCAGRRHQLPAQLQHRPGGGGRRRHLPQDGIPRAPQPLRLLRLLRAGRGFDTQREAFLGPLPRLGQAGGRGSRRADQLHRARLVAHRRASGEAGSCSRARRGRSSSSSATTRTRSTRSSILPARRPSTRRPSSR